MRAKSIEKNGEKPAEERPAVPPPGPVERPRRVRFGEGLVRLACSALLGLVLLTSSLFSEASASRLRFGMGIAGLVLCVIEAVHFRMRFNPPAGEALRLRLATVLSFVVLLAVLPSGFGVVSTLLLIGMSGVLGACVTYFLMEKGNESNRADDGSGAGAGTAPAAPAEGP